MHKLVITFAYTNWQNNSLQDVGMQLLDMGIAGVANAVAGADLLGGLTGLGSGLLGVDDISSSITDGIEGVTNDVIGGFKNLF
jgi:hypothetical protein